MMNPSVKLILFIFLFALGSSVFAAGEFLVPSTSGHLTNTSVSTTSSVFSDIDSFNFTIPLPYPTKCFPVVTMNSVGSGGSGQVGEWRVMINGTQLGRTSRSIANGEQANTFMMGDPILIPDNSTSYIIQVQSRQASGTGTLVTNYANTVVFCMRDLNTATVLDYVNSSFANITVNNLAFGPSVNITLNISSPEQVVLFLTSQQTKNGTAGQDEYYANITYSNGTIFTCPTITRFAGANAQTSTGIACITPVAAPAGNTTVQFYSRCTAGSYNASGKIQVFGYGNATDFVDGKMKILTGVNISSTSPVQHGNVSIEADYNNTNIYSIATFSGNTSVNGLVLTSALSIQNSTGGTPPSMIDNNTYFTNRSWPTLGQDGERKMQRDFRNLTEGNYTVFLNSSVSAGTFFTGGGTLLAIRTDRIPNLAEPLKVSIFTPANTTYYKVNGSEMNINYSSAFNGINISYYNISLITDSGSFVIDISTNNSLNLNYTWNYSAVALGSYRVQVSATDILGQMSTVNSSRFTIAGAIPTTLAVYVSSPSNNTNVTSVSFLFNATSSGNTTINCSLYLQLIAPVVYVNGFVSNNTNTIFTPNVTIGGGNWTGWITCFDGTTTNSSGVYSFRVLTPINVTTLTYTYADVSVPYVDVKTIFSLFLLSVALYMLYASIYDIVS